MTDLQAVDCEGGGWLEPALDHVECLALELHQRTSFM